MTQQDDNANSAEGDLRSQVTETLEISVEKFLDSHAGRINVTEVSADGDVVIEFAGACRACPANSVTFYSKVVPAIQQVAGVRSVSTPQVSVSEAASRRIAAIVGPRPPRGRPA
jgi:Fe-S cluster biogenesis protein NfuA